jgi:hypothetical protein
MSHKELRSFLRRRRWWLAPLSAVLLAGVLVWWFWPRDAGPQAEVRPKQPSWLDAFDAASLSTSDWPRRPSEGVAVLPLDKDAAPLRVTVKEDLIYFKTAGGKEVGKIDGYAANDSGDHFIRTEPYNSFAGAVLSPAGDRLVVIGKTNPGISFPPQQAVNWLQVWVSEETSLKPLPVQELDGDHCRSAVFSPDGTLLALVKKGCIDLWEVGPQELKHCTKISRSEVMTCAFSADNRRLVIVDVKGVNVHDLDPVLPGGWSERFRHNLLWALLSFGVTAVALTVVRVLPRKVAALLVLRIPGIREPVAEVPPSRWDRALKVGAAVAGLGGLVCLAWWGCLAYFAAPTPLTPTDCPLAKVTATKVTFSPDGRSLAAVLPSGDLAAFDIETGAQTGKWTMPERVSRAEYAPDGRHLLGMTDRKAYVLRLRTFDEDAYILACCEVELKDNPNSVAALMARGQVYRKKGDLHRAIADFTKAIERDESNAVANYQRGLARADAGDLAGARDDLDKAVRLDRKLDHEAKSSKQTVEEATKDAVEKEVAALLHRDLRPEESVLVRHLRATKKSSDIAKIILDADRPGNAP